jgi:hypothetical protein
MRGKVSACAELRHPSFENALARAAALGNRQTVHMWRRGYSNPTVEEEKRDG